MSRNSPEIIEKHKNDIVETQILESNGAWAVLRDGKSFNVRKIFNATPGTYQYLRSVFPTKGHASVLAKKLNTMFATDIYTVINLLESYNDAKQ